MTLVKREPSSFRDPAGFIFFLDGDPYRQLNPSHFQHFERFIESGFYGSLLSDHLIIPHEEVARPHEERILEQDARFLKLKKVPFIMYPYEWCFSQLKDAALLTLEIAERALKFGMCLKDCSAYNIQFLDGRPIFIDTLSFENYQQGQPWQAYQQFCEHFLGPLLVMSKSDPVVIRILRTFHNGLPLKLATKLVPGTTWLNPHLALHMLVHSNFQSTFSNKQSSAQVKRNVGDLAPLLDNLKTAVTGLKLKKEHSTWDSYYTCTHNYSAEGFAFKQNTVSNLIDLTKPAFVWDIGANDGTFSRLASTKNILTISMDSDHQCVENNYLTAKRENDRFLLPMFMDFSNPSPRLGWGENERRSLSDRAGVDLVLMLGLVHHLALTENIPLAAIAGYARKLGKKIIVEFVPPDDEQSLKLLGAKTISAVDLGYSQENFESAFSDHFRIESTFPIPTSGRFLYLMDSLTK